MHKLSALVLASGLALSTSQASAVTVTFDDLAAGAVLSNQYASVGVTFAANAFSGVGSSTSGATWATNTDMTIVSSTGSDVGSLGSPSLAGGNVLRSVSNQLLEDGDASFRMTFSTAVTSVSVTFAGVSTAADTRIFAYSGSTLLATVAGSGSNGQFALAYSAPSITSVVVAPGSFADYVAVDNVVFAPVPEPAAVVTMGLGVLLCLRALRQRALDQHLLDV